MSIITNGVGGQKNTFRTAQDYLTNDPAFFQKRSISHTSRYAKLGPMNAMNKFTVEDPVNQPYFYVTAKDGVTTANITKNNFFKTAEAVNNSSKVFYSTCLDGKGNSKVFNTKESASMPAAGGAPS